MTRKAIMIASIVLAVAATQSFGALMLTELQNGENGYSGQRNEVMAGSGWGGAGYSSRGTPVGAEHVFVMGADFASTLWVGRSLIRFDDIASMLPAGHTTVISATLELGPYVWRYNPVDPVVARQALQPWTDDEDGGGTWWTNWGNGGNDAGYIGDIVGTFNPTAGQTTDPTSITLDTSTVESWITSPGTNYGVILMYDADTGSDPHLEWPGENDPDNPPAYNQIPPKLILETVPEPATMALLGLGGLMVLRRRRAA